MSSGDFNANVPLVTDPFADWQVSFLKNFKQLYNASSVNHVPLDDPIVANRGNHTIIELMEQDTEIQTNIGEMSIYTKNVESQTDQIFMEYEGNGTEFQYTNYQLYTLDPIKNGATIVQNQYFTFLPGKIIVYFGSLEVGSTPNIILNPPVAKNIITVNLTAKDATTSNGTPTPVSIAQEGIIRQIGLLTLNGPGTMKLFYVVLANC